MLNLFFSNRFEVLREQLLARLAVAPKDPFVPEQIIVPGAAMRRRLEMDYANRFGVCAHVQFGYLAQWVWQQLGLVIDVQQASPFDAERLTWRIFHTFGDESFVSPHPRLAGYLEKADAVMRYELAQRVARLIEQYITYRPDWIAAWSDFRSDTLSLPAQTDSPDEGWQADLWRHLAAAMDIPVEHPFSRFLRALDSEGHDSGTARRLQPASLFCLPTIPPLYLEILTKLAGWVDLDLYVLTPCKEFWEDLVDPKRLARLEATGKADYHEVGHPLLSGWGRQTQAFVTLLHEKSAGEALEQERFVAADENTLLAAIQRDILHLTKTERPNPPVDDRSIEVHVCHSLTRELEVLHDQLLDLFAGPEEISPGDVLVVMPALDEAAPLIHAIFGTVPENRRIPYVVTGLPPAVANPAASALLALLALLASRFKAGDVFDLLRRPLIQARFGLDESSLESIHGWMRQAGICWGLDGTHRETLGLPKSEHHSLRDGLNRLFLGYAVPGLSESLCGRLPSGDAEGSEALALGAFDRFVRGLEHARTESSNPSVGEVWRERLNRWVDDFLSVDSRSVHDITEVRQAIAALFDDLAASSVDEPLDFEVIRRSLKDRLQNPAHGALPSGAVTFAGMSPLRNLPYAVICMLGLNDGAFPTMAHPDEFDLIARNPRLGDRQRRYDERNLFLDLVLSARKRLHLSYTGFSIRDNSALTPSILLAELLDHVSSLLAPDPASADSLQQARRKRIVHHPLQPFSPDYFTGTQPRLFSYAGEYAETIASPSPSRVSPVDTITEPPGETFEDDDTPEVAAPFLNHPLPWPPEQPRALTVSDLKRFLRNPCRYLLERRLELTLLEAEEQLADDEPFLPDYQRRGSLAERLLPFIRRGARDREVLNQAQSGTEYPIGVFGEVLLQQEIGLLTAFAQHVERLSQEPLLPPVARELEFTIDGERWCLSSALNDVRTNGLIRWRYDDTRPANYLSGWIDHLCLNALTPLQAKPETTWISRDGSYRLNPCDEARTRLHTLVDYYRRGLAEPLRFFPKSAWAYARALAEGHSKALADARKVWQKNEHTGFGESTAPAYRLALRGIADPLDESFEQAATDIFGPLLDHLEDARLS